MALALGPLVVLAAVLVPPRPAGAVQSSTFGISPAPGTPQTGGDRLAATGRPGVPVTGQLLVWNRTASALVLDLSVEPAHLGPKGVPALGGLSAPTRWVHLGQPQVTLGPHATKLIPVTVALPRVLPPLPAQAAVVATPETGAKGGVSILVRLAVLISMNAARNAPSRAPVGTIGWVALSVLVVAALVAAAVLWRRRRPRPGSSQARPASARNGGRNDP